MIDLLSADKHFTERLEEKEGLAISTSIEGEESIINDYIEPLRELLEKIRNSEDPYSRPEREARTQTAIECQEEINTWELVQLMLKDVLLTTSNCFPPPEISSNISSIPTHRWWAVSHKQLVSLRLSWDFSFRRIVLALIWLESVYAQTCRIDNKVEEYIPPGFRPATASLLSEGLGGSSCPLTRRKLVSSLEFDAPSQYVFFYIFIVSMKQNSKNIKTNREQAFIHPADEDAERTLYSVLLQHIRCGHIRAARDLCESKQHLIAAALMKETAERLQHIPGVHDSIVPSNVPLQPEITQRLRLEETGKTRTNTHHFSVSASMLELACENMSCGGEAQCATFGALSGMKESMLKSYKKQEITLRDILWASLSGAVEHMIHCVVQPTLRDHVDYNEEDAEIVIQQTKPLFDSLAGASQQALVERGESDCLIQLQALLLQLFGHSRCCDVSILIAVFELLSNKVVEVSPRLAAHLALLLWRCRNGLLSDLLSGTSHDYISSLLDSTLMRYAQKMYQSNPNNSSLLLTTIPFISSKMEKRGIELASIYVVSLVTTSPPEKADECLVKLVSRLNNLNVNTAAVLNHASKLMSTSPWETVRSWSQGSVSAEGPQEVTFGHKTEAIRLMTYLPVLSEDALRMFNQFCRDIILRIQELNCRSRYCLSSSEVDQVDNIAAGVAELMSAFRLLFNRVYTAVDEQFQRRILTEKQTSLAFVKLTTERMEASHWELIQTSLSSLSSWKHSALQKPLDNPPVEKMSAPKYGVTVQATWLQCLEESQKQRFEKVFALWADSEKKSRNTMKRQALRVISRDNSACLVDMTSVAKDLEPLPLAEAKYWFEEREQSLRQLRAAVIPDIVEGILEALALYADHLSVEDRLKEGEEYVIIIT